MDMSIQCIFIIHVVKSVGKGNILVYPSKNSNHFSWENMGISSE